MSELIFTKPSPRLENGVLTWFKGDTFNFRLALSLYDQTGGPIDIAETDSLKINFYNAKNELIKTFAFGEGGEAVEDGNTVCLAFSDATSGLFEKGSYHYDIILEGTETTTVTSNAPAAVE